MNTPYFYFILSTIFISTIFNCSAQQAYTKDVEDRLNKKYDYIKDYGEGIAIVQKKDKYGVVDYEGNVIVKIEYNDIKFIREDLGSYNYKLRFIKTTIQYNGIYDQREGLLLPNGKEIVPIGKYSQIDDFNFKEGCATVSGGKNSGGGWVKGIIDTNGVEVLSADHSYLSSCSCGLIIKVKYEGRDDDGDEIYKYGLADKNGREIIGFDYDLITTFQNNLSGVKQGDKFGIINNQGKIVAPVIYESILKYFTEGMIGLKKNGFWGFIDYTGKEMIPFKFEQVSKFSDGLAWFKESDKYGYIDKSGKIIIAATYDKPGLFEDGVAYVTLNGKSVKINKQGYTVE